MRNKPSPHPLTITTWWHALSLVMVLGLACLSSSPLMAATQQEL
ncbi:MAG: peptidase M23, partial [Vibrio sp.]|nr:peptidase M23 [Vibrio sp.]